MTHELKRFWKCGNCGHESEEWYDFVETGTKQATCPQCGEHLT